MNTYLHIVCNGPFPSIVGFGALGMFARLRRSSDRLRLLLLAPASVRGHGRSLVRAATVPSTIDPGRRELSGTLPAWAPLPQAGRGDDNGQQQPEVSGRCRRPAASPAVIPETSR